MRMVNAFLMVSWVFSPLSKWNQQRGGAQTGMQVRKIAIFLHILQESLVLLTMFICVGVLVTKAMTSVTKEVSRDFLVNKVLPAIKERWPAEEKGLPI